MGALILSVGALAALSLPFTVCALFRELATVGAGE